MSLQKQAKEIIKKLKKDLEHVEDTPELEKLKVQYLGRKAKLSSLLKTIKDLPQKERATAGNVLNKAKIETQNLLGKKAQEIKLAKLKNLDKSDKIDVTEPGIRPQKGSLHPISKLLYESVDIFQKMGFSVYEPFEIDDDYHNFESINIPKEHPARDSWDTFWTEDGDVLVTHTSSMQNRILKKSSPPIRAIVPGKCFRNEATDARHEHTFYQIEGIYADKGITFTNMLGTLKTYFEAFFKKDIKIKFMPDYFPFVEPGGQIALSCVLCDGKGCKVCKNSGWLEILGCGMIHPNVLKEAGIDPETYTGFAWGFGLERLIMLKHGINDIRLFHSGDIRFIKQFK